MSVRFKRSTAVGIAAALALLSLNVPVALADTGDPVSGETPSVTTAPTESAPTPTEAAGAVSPSPLVSESASSTPTPTPTTSPVPLTEPAAEPMAMPMATAALEPCTGVWVAVQSDDVTDPVVTCVAPGSDNSALGLLKDTAHSVVETGGFVDQIDGLPENTDWNTNGNIFWSFCTAAVNATSGSLTWAIAGLGAGSIFPEAGSAVGFRLAQWTDDPATQCPALTEVPVDPDATPTPTTTATSSATSSPRPASAAARAAANWLSRNLPARSDTDGHWQTVLGLATMDQCRYAPTVRSQLALLKQQATDYTEDNPGRAARLAIVAAAVGEDPTDFGGVDLIQVIIDGTQGDGQVGSSGNPFSQSLAIIALVRAGEGVPPAMISNLLTYQNDAGAFGFGSGESFWADLDSTGLAIQALHGAGGGAEANAAMDKAIAWALSQQTPAGNWPNDFSPVNTTGLVGSALDLVGSSSGNAVAWMRTQQLANGALPDTLDGDDANRWATQEGLFLLTGTTYLTATFSLDTCADSSSAGGSSGGDLADTGASDATLPLGLAGIALVVIGGLLIASRRDRRLAR